MTATQFNIFSDEPTDAFLAAIAKHNITIRGWKRSSSRFKSGRYTERLEKGVWLNPHDKRGTLYLSVDGDRSHTDDDPVHGANRTIYDIGEQLGLYVSIGAVQIES